MQRHSLHVDHAGVLEAELFLLLVGQSTPAELVKGLTDAGIDQEKVRAIVEDVNTEVFIRLRTEEQKAPSIPTPTLTPTAPATQKVIPIYEASTLKTSPTTPSIPIYSPLPTIAPPHTIEKVLGMPKPPKQVLPAQPLPGQMPQSPDVSVPVVQSHIAPPPPIPAPASIVSIPMPEAQPLDTSTRVIHTMARDMKALKDGVDPIRVAHPAPPAWVAVEAPRPQAAAAIPAPTQPTPERESPEAAMRTHLKQYGVDPYREPMQ